MQVELVANDIERAVDILKQNQVEFVSPQLVQFPKTYFYRQGCLIKDPNGHAMLLIME
ncbi:hypothetical protein [Calothrix sp. CCY 0018]|uniref:hypothetical protein n=1 Tax=Calothrix sp. CCY 0018 TaxID=3103864 RepID=UPI0039C675F3